MFFFFFAFCQTLMRLLCVHSDSSSIVSGRAIFRTIGDKIREGLVVLVYIYIFNKGREKKKKRFVFSKPNGMDGYE